MKKVKEYRMLNREVQDINVLESEAIYSYADYLKWSFEERVELIKGKVFRMSPAPNRIHQKIAGNLHAKIWNLLENKHCEVYPAPFDVRFPQKKGLSDKETFTVVRPDICVICDPDKLDHAGCVGAPDLIVEILSASTSQKDLTHKFQLYEEFGVKEYWVVYPDTRIVEIFYLEGPSYSRPIKYTGDDPINTFILNGLNLSTYDVFKAID